MADSGSTVGTPIGGGVTLGAEGIGLEPTLLAPFRYAQIMQINQPHFAQLDGALAPLKGGCDDVWDHDAREALVWAIQQAEEMIADHLGFWPAPKWITNEEIRVGRVRSDWWNAEFTTRWKHVQAFGTQTLTLLQANATVGYTDDDNDPLGREETATVGEPGIYSYLATCADPCDVRVYFRTADGAWDAADPRFEIRNLRADIDGDQMFLKGESSMFIQPHLWTITEAEASDGSWVHDFDTANLVSYVDVYCESVNECIPIILYWEGLCTCGAPCSHSTQNACAYATNMERGHFVPRPAVTCNTWTTAPYSYPPVKMRINYLAGYPLDPRTCRINSLLERAIVKLTNVLLPEPPCGYCDSARKLWDNDRKAVDPLTPEAASMPWDLYSQGALEAWRIVKRFARGGGGSVRGS